MGIFNKIRRTYLKESRFTRYLLYAAGEIVLVVLGILIALQINTWNEQRKISIQRKGLTESIVNDLVKDSVNLQSFINQLRRDSTTMHSLELRLQSIPVNYDTIRTMFRYEFPAFVRADYSFNNTTLVSVIENQRNIYPKDIVDSLVPLIKWQKDFETVNKIFIENYFFILNSRNNYPFGNYFFNGGEAMQDSIWAAVDNREMLADFEQIADWKMANTLVVLATAKNLQANMGRIRNELIELEE